MSARSFNRTRLMAEAAAIGLQAESVIKDPAVQKAAAQAWRDSRRAMQSYADLGHEAGSAWLRARHGFRPYYAR